MFFKIATALLVPTVILLAWAYSRTRLLLSVVAETKADELAEEILETDPEIPEMIRDLHDMKHFMGKIDWLGERIEWLKEEAVAAKDEMVILAESAPCSKSMVERVIKEADFRAMRYARAVDSLGALNAFVQRKGDLVEPRLVLVKTGLGKIEKRPFCWDTLLDLAVVEMTAEE